MSGSCREAFPDDREWLVGPPGCPGVVGRPSRISLSGQEALPNVREPFRMSGSGLEALPGVSGQDALLDVQEWSGCPPGCPGVVEKPSQISGSGRERLPDVPEFGRPFWMSGICWHDPWTSEWPSWLFGSHRDTLSNARRWSRGPSGCPGVIRRHSRMTENGREALQDVREWSGVSPGYP